LAPRPGTNVALMNALLHEIVENDWVDHDYVDNHTVGFDELAKQVADYPAELAARVCDVPVEDIREAARVLGQAERLLSTVLQGFYQSHQATAAAVQVNNLNLVRGMLGKPGCGILQMNGQPTAQNTRECGADGDLPGFRNWANDIQVSDLAKVWNLDPMQIPHYSEPTHLMQIMRYVEDGSIRFLYVSCTNPAVSLPELGRIRQILSQDRLFLVVQDIFLSETAQLADVVLPAATWGEKTGTFTNADRTVHLSEKAVDPPGEARPDLDIFLDYADRLGLQDKDGQPLVKWHTPEEAFEAWKECSAGRPCDYTGLTYAKLRGGSGIQWPCNSEHPDGTERLYADGRFWSDPDYCESYGRDLVTGASQEPQEYQAKNPAGRAMLKPAEYLPPHEQPTDDFPYILITGRTLYHFHTRTKTGRAPQLQKAAPEVWVEVSENDATQQGWTEGDLLRVSTPRGQVEAPLRISGIRPGVVFLPFHYGYWDTPAGHRPESEDGRAANELTITDWDPASKQPLFKSAAAQVERIRRGGGEPSAAPTTTGSAPVRDVGVQTRGGQQAVAVEELIGGEAGGVR
jgi:anaerobic selenocysteine-containing dehydrogenase